MGKNNFGKLGGKIRVVSFSGGLGNQMLEYALCFGRCFSECKAVV